MADVPQVKSLESLEEFRAAIDGEKPVIIDFWAQWCGPCKMISPFFVKFAAIYPELDFYKVNAEEREDIADEVGLRNMPSFMVFSKGNKIREFCGSKPPELSKMIGEVVDALTAEGPATETTAPPASTTQPEAPAPAAAVTVEAPPSSATSGSV